MALEIKSIYSAKRHGGCWERFQISMYDCDLHHYELGMVWSGQSEADEKTVQGRRQMEKPLSRGNGENWKQSRLEKQKGWQNSL